MMKKMTYKHHIHPLKTEIYKQGYTMEGFCEKIGIHRHTLLELFARRTKCLRGDTICLVSKGLKMPYEKVAELCQ